jgi:hypothetical protein
MTQALRSRSIGYISCGCCLRLKEREEEEEEEEEEGGVLKMTKLGISVSLTITTEKWEQEESFRGTCY